MAGVMCASRPRLRRVHADCSSFVTTTAAGACFRLLPIRLPCSRSIRERRESAGAQLNDELTEPADTDRLRNDFARSGVACSEWLPLQDDARGRRSFPRRQAGIT
ncbi:hypothetical protein Bxe_A0265 [Paraburkholderia xenovorans LB400]|uniref:Uncharacterized protein n=1 Tax=Paraburkholderia xenovorans (strain LB400) TaxID=266265 RepID=Q13TC1_PARXL|nr:hypothetical protein Bxe_A0265 [Paraburkholderia xenovorans LB400]